MSWEKICLLSDLVEHSGRAARIGEKQVAVFYVPNEVPSVYALDNWDPVGEAFVLSRGIVGDIGGELCVASPLYKEHYALADGRCLDADGIAVKSWAVEVRGEEVWLKAE